ncbi:Uncharacterized protein Adt_03195 [Abeliophyllum distichum]|uniref:DUF4283 domain-containing protein n=1 Tax=Abeliophyllum distichum TaxID=126358 RepID=A0ABD1VXT1_9LAMI
MPLWVVLPGLPVDCWNAEALGMIASKIGRPISMDNLTYTKGRLSYARVLIEVDAAAKLVRNVNVLLATGKQRDQKVVYEHEPKFCSCCRMFWHSLSNCAALEKSFETSLKVSTLAEVNDGVQPPVLIAVEVTAKEQVQLVDNVEEAEILTVQLSSVLDVLPDPPAIKEKNTQKQSMNGIVLLLILDDVMCLIGCMEKGWKMKIFSM